MGAIGSNKGGLTIPLGQGGQILNLYECKIEIAGVGDLSGTLEVPTTTGGNIPSTKYEVRLDEYDKDIHALVWKTDGGVKTNELAETAAGDLVDVTLAGADNRNYTIPVAPSAYPVILTFVFLANASAMRNADWDYVKYVETMISVAVDGVTITGSGVPGDPLIGAAEPVNADWNATEGLAEIKNKPTFQEDTGLTAQQLLSLIYAGL